MAGLVDERDRSGADLAARRWRLEDYLIGSAHKAVEMYELEPMLTDYPEDAVREQDRDAFDEALADAPRATMWRRMFGG